MSDGKALIGIPASPGRRRGRACVCRSVGEFPRLRVGEILVARFASPETVLVFDKVAAIVTDQGGRLAHASLVARELGIPAVVGTQNATQEIRDGSIIEVDGGIGTVKLES